MRRSRNSRSAKRPLPDGEALAEVERAVSGDPGAHRGAGPGQSAGARRISGSQQRYDFLNAQRQDLLDSIRDTEKAIQEIDEVSRQKFTEAFEAINANFREMFQTLFGGGSGEMRLTDETNIADSGIDIVASPPGKKLQNVLLLSGGEKALTALALLMAIFRYQPSPFCILDEVDAPLDEPNIERLTRLLRGDVGRHAVHPHHALQEDHGIRAGDVRRDHAGARRFETGVGEVRRASGERGSSTGGVKSMDQGHGSTPEHPLQHAIRWIMEWEMACKDSHAAGMWWALKERSSVAIVFGCARLDLKYEDNAEFCIGNPQYLVIRKDRPEQEVTYIPWGHVSGLWFSHADSYNRPEFMEQLSKHVM